MNRSIIDLPPNQVVPISYAVEVQNLTKRFGAFTAVDDVSFAVEEGEIFGFLGPNGSGKSTMIRMLCGLLIPNGGHGHVAGLDITRDAERIRARIGYMPQLFSLYDDLTVAENMSFYAGLYSVPQGEAQARIAQLAERLEFTDSLDRLTRTLSTGWRQRLSLATSTLHVPPIVFLDEPTSGVDPSTRRLFWEVIDDISHDGATVFVTTHVMDEAEHCTRLAMMHYGKLIADGTPEQMRREHVRNMVEVTTERVWNALALLQKSDCVREVALFGNALHVECGEEEADPVGRIQGALRQSGIADAQVKRVDPTMEDVFVSLARARPGAEEAEARS